MQTTIKDRIKKYGSVAWRDVKPLQSEEFKKYKKEQIQKLKNSIKKNGFATPLFIWQNPKNEMILLDGFHRIIALKELEDIDGDVIPSKLPAIYIDCKNHKDAKKMLLLLNSHYATIRQDELLDFITDLDFEDLKAEIDIPGLDLDDITPEDPNDDISVGA